MSQLTLVLNMVK